MNNYSCIIVLAIASGLIKTKTFSFDIVIIFLQHSLKSFVCCFENGRNNKGVFADLHIHSRFSRACSKDITIDNLEKWARIKGIGFNGNRRFYSSSLA